MIFYFFHKVGNTLVDIDRFMMWVSAGRMSALISLIVKVSIMSRPKELELLRLVRIFSTSSGCTHDREKEQVLPFIKE